MMKTKVKTKTEQVICCKCKHYDYVEYAGPLCFHPSVKRKPVSICPVTGQPLYRGGDRPFCSAINRDKNCQRFEKKCGFLQWISAKVLQGINHEN